MDEQQYYRTVLDKMEKCFQFSDYVVATGEELVAEGADPAFPAITRSSRELAGLTVERQLQVHIPVIGANSQSVLTPLDFEIYLGEQQHQLYTDKQSQKQYFEQTVPVIDWIKQLLTRRGMPFLLDYTPSGGHILWHNLVDYRYAQEIMKIGYLEEELIVQCQRRIAGDWRRHNGVSWQAASVFSGLTRLADYLALLTIDHFSRQPGNSPGLPVAISDSEERCINLDNSWCEGSPYMRSIRSPFSLHKKNRERFGQRQAPPLVDVIGGYFDGVAMHGEITPAEAVECMWDLKRAAEHADRFSGYIPCANDSLIDFIAEYRASDLYQFHCEFDRQDSLQPGEALYRAERDGRLSAQSRRIINKPNPLAVQPYYMRRLTYDLVVGVGWAPTHVANLLADLYLSDEPRWTQDFRQAYPAAEKAGFWARIFSALALWQTGKIKFKG
ncbi:MAG: hypothetical protein N3A57_02145 [Negativicutes bacterium]|nr:hypothetical protein [Negativicutes bacterium]